MFQKICFGLILLAFGHSAYAQINLPGKCQQFHMMDKLDTSEYVGTWYLVGKYPYNNIKNLKCFNDNYTLVNSRNISFHVNAINEITNKQITYDGNGLFTSHGQHLVYIPGNPNVQGTKYTGITDYKSYNVKFVCENLENNTHNLMVWLLTRDPHPSEETVKKMHSILQKNHVSLAPLLPVDQSDCPKANSF